MNEFKLGNPLINAIKDVDVKQSIVKAYYVNYEHVDSDDDLLSEGMYNKSIKEWGPGTEHKRIKHLFNHFDGSGKLTELNEDVTGGWFVSKLGRHTTGRDVALMYEDGIITEHSHGFEVVNSRPATVDGKEIRVITEGRLWEVSSLDKWGANFHTNVIKSKEDKGYWIKRLDTMTKALKDGTYTDETFALLEIQLYHIKQLIRSFDEPEQVTTAHIGTQPEQATTQETKVSWDKIIVNHKI